MNLEKAVAVAKDVIARIDAEKLRAMTGAYIETDDRISVYVERFAECNWEEQIQPHVDALEEVCQVCALGGGILSAIRLYDDMTFSRLFPYRGYSPDWKMVNTHFRDIFGELNTLLIESAFEVYPLNNTLPHRPLTDHERELQKRAVEFGYRHRGGGALNAASRRMRAIYANVVENEGNFVPPPIPEPATVEE